MKITYEGGTPESFDYVVWADGRENPVLDRIGRLGDGFAPVTSMVPEIGKGVVASTILRGWKPDPDLLIVGPSFLQTLSGSGEGLPGPRLQELGIRTRSAVRDFFKGAEK